MAKKGFWLCSRCGYENGPKRHKCFVCGNPQSAPVSGSVETSSPVPDAEEPSPVSQPTSLPPAKTSVSPDTEKELDEVQLPGFAYREGRIVSNLSWGAPISSKGSDSGNGKRAVSSDQVTQWIEWLAFGTESQVEKALQQFEDWEPVEAIPQLIQIASGEGINKRKVESEERKVAALIALSSINSVSTTEAIINRSWLYDLNPIVCAALGRLGHPVAVDYLLEVVKHGLYESAASALFALGILSDSRAIAPLVLDSKREFYSTRYIDDLDNPLMNSSGLGFKLLGAALAISDQSMQRARLATFMVDPELDLTSVMRMPGEVRLMWLLHLRVAVLTHLAEECGRDAFEACWSQAKKSIQRLMVALPLLATLPAEREWLNALADSARAKFMHERILAFERLVNLAGEKGDEVFHKWVLVGLRDRDSKVQAVVATSIIYQEVESLIPQALTLIDPKSSSPNTRISMIPAILYLAQAGDSRGEAALQQLLNDPKKQVREVTTNLRAITP